MVSEIACPSCHTTTPLWNRRCIHCGHLRQPLDTGPIDLHLSKNGHAIPHQPAMQPYVPPIK